MVITNMSAYESWSPCCPARIQRTKYNNNNERERAARWPASPCPPENKWAGAVTYSHIRSYHFFFTPLCWLERAGTTSLTSQYYLDAQFRAVEEAVGVHIISSRDSAGMRETNQRNIKRWAVRGSHTPPPILSPLLCYEFSFSLSLSLSLRSLFIRSCAGWYEIISRTLGLFDEK